MADIIITPIPSIASPSGPLAVTADGAALTATESQGKTLLAALPTGSILTGFVLNRDPAGNPILRTDSGDFLLQSKLFLKIGSEVVIRLSGSGVNARANLVSVDGLPPEEAAALPAHGEVHDVVATPRQALGTPTALQSGTTQLPFTGNASANSQTGSANTGTQATVQTGAAPATQQATITQATLIRAATQAEMPAGMTALPTNTQLRVQVLTIAPPIPPNTPVASETPQPSGSANTALPSYNAYTRNIPLQTSLPSTLPSPLSTSTPAGNQTPLPSSPLVTTVLRSFPSGEMLLSSALGDVHVALPIALPEGSRVTIQVLQALSPEAALVANTPTNPTAVLPALAQGWDSVEQLLTQLVSADPKAAKQFVQNVLPHVLPNNPNNPNPMQSGLQNLSTGLLFFLNALSNGNMREWIGPRNTQFLENTGHGELLQKAQSEFGMMRQLYADAPPHSWQALFLPVLVEGEMRPIRFFTRRERERGEKRGRNQPRTGDTRFVVETELSQLGPLQLDGFVKKRDTATEFDLVVRSHGAFSEAEKNELRELYIRTGEATGYTGTIMFQETLEFPVNPMEEVLAQAHAEVTV